MSKTGWKVMKWAGAGIPVALVIFFSIERLVAHFAPNPSINMTDLTIETGAAPLSCETTGLFRIHNTSGGDGIVMVESVGGNVEFIGPGGTRTTCAGGVNLLTPLIAGHVLGPNEFTWVPYSLSCDAGCPADTREIKNYMSVKLVGRNDIFSSSGSFKFEGVQ